MRFLTKKRVKSHILETIIGSLMVLFAALAIYIMVEALSTDPSPESAIIEILIVIILAILAQTILLIKIFEQKLNR